MAAPLKPWEKVGVNSQNANNTFSNQMSSLPDSTFPTTSIGDRQTYSSAAPPPIPTRPSQGNGLNTYGGVGSGYSSYGNSMYGNGGYGNSMLGGGMYGGGGGLYGGYGGYGGGMYGGGYNRFGQQNYTTNSFVQQAEDSSRQAFQSVESVVQAFGSIAMMLDSTFYALYNSFRAVLGVADQFSRVKAHFGQILSALAVIRTLRWLWRKFLVLIRLRQPGLPEDIWTQAAEDGVKAVLSEQELKPGGRGLSSSWPIFIFFAVIFGGPWLIWKLLSRFQGDIGRAEWMSGKDEHYAALAEYDFMGEGDEELSFRRGQRIIVAPKELQPKVRGWLLASIDGSKTGIIPANYVKILGKRSGTNNVKNDTQAQYPSRENNAMVPAGTQQPQQNTNVTFKDFNEHFKTSQSMSDLSFADQNQSTLTSSKDSSELKTDSFSNLSLPDFPKQSNTFASPKTDTLDTSRSFLQDSENKLNDEAI